VEAFIHAAVSRDMLKAGRRRRFRRINKIGLGGGACPVSDFDYPTAV